MSMHYTRQILFLLFALALFATSIPLHAQVTTATLYGVVRDTSGAVLPGARVTATNQGTTFSRDVVADERGEFALPALPAGAYTVKIEMTGFKTYTNQGLQLGSKRASDVHSRSRAIVGKHHRRRNRSACRNGVFSAVAVARYNRGERAA